MKGAETASPDTFMQTLPANIKAEVWQTWPRKVEAHLIWKVRARQVDTAVGRKKLACYLCPDKTVRIPTEQLVKLFGEAPEVGNVDTARAPAEINAIDIDDPVVMMFREAVTMLRQSEQAKLDVLKLLLDPMNAALKANREVAEDLRDVIVKQAARISELEGARDQTIKEREELADNRMMRDLVMGAELATQERRKRITDKLIEQIPLFTAKWTGGTLSDFIGSLDPAEVELFLATDFLKPEQKTQVRALLERQALARKLAAEKAAREAAAAAAKAEAEKPKEHSAANGAAAATPTGGN